MELIGSNICSYLKLQMPITQRLLNEIAWYSGYH